MCAGERPNAVIDSRRVPSACRVTLRTSALLRFGDELVSVGVFVAVDATLSRELEIVARTPALVASRARNRLMSTIESELGATVLLYGERSGPKATLVVTSPAIHVAESAPMHVAMAVATAFELEPSIPALGRELR